MLSAAAPIVIWNAARSSTPMEKNFMLVCWKRSCGDGPKFSLQKQIIDKYSDHRIFISIG